jgi:hypothetical protein
VTRLPAALVAALVLACAAPAHANLLASGEIDRGEDGAASLVITIGNTSDSGELFQAARLELPAAAGQVSDINTSAGAPASCAAAGGGVVQCQFPPPYLHPGETVQMSLITEQPIADDVGAKVFACPYPCAPPYAGPFSLNGPFPSKDPPIDAVALVTKFRNTRIRRGDACAPAKPMFKVALGTACISRDRAKLRVFVANRGELPLALTIFGSGPVQRLRVPANAAAGFVRKSRLTRPGKLTVVNGADGGRTSLPMRLPPKRKAR